MSHHKLIYAPLLIVVLFVVAVKVVMDYQMIETQKQSLENRQLLALDSVYSYLSEQPSLQQQEDIQQALVQLKNMSGYRVTMVLRNGEVIADSNLTLPEIWVLGSYSDKPEIIKSRVNRYGIAWRFSDILQQEMLYSARELEFNSRSATLRLSSPVGDLEGLVSAQRPTFYGISLVALAITAFIGFLVTRHIQQLIRKEHRLLEDRVEERTQDVNELNRVGTLIGASNDFGEIEQVLRAAFSKLMPHAAGAVAVYHASRDKLELESSWGDSETVLEGMYMPDECWGLKKGTFHLCESGEQGIHCTHNVNLGFDVNTLCIPLMAQGEILGALHLYSKQKSYLEERMLLAQSLAESVSIKIANLQLRETLRNQAIRDPLTGLYNRRYLQENLDKEFNRCQRSGRSFAAMMIDVDHFKRFNDEYGHEAGDLVLSRVGKILNDGVRREDIACRYGGEEFTVILMDSNTKYAMEVAERIRQQVSEMEILHEGKVLPTVTLSVGVAMYKEGHSSFEEIISTADETLYQAKAAGRNTVRMAA